MNVCFHLPLFEINTNKLIGGAKRLALMGKKESLPIAKPLAFETVVENKEIKGLGVVEF